ncbi:MAG: helix-turn-helix transcriptional regulator [Bacteroides sp.]|nr:helix-turn-helix transcriptional regulator [Bacteroides sp.]
MGNLKPEWEKVYDFVYECGKVHDPKKFCQEIAQHVGELCPCDHVRVFFLDGNDHVADRYLIGVSKKKVDLYFDYFSEVEDGKYKIPRGLLDETDPYKEDSVVHIRDWTKVADDEFVRDYVRPLGLSCSLGFSLFNASGHHAVAFCLDRTRAEHFSPMEIQNLNYAVPLLNNHYKNFSSVSMGRKKMVNISPEFSGLTHREAEVVMLLCTGISTDSISRKLHISRSTVYKHIAHIYEKLKVSSRQELLAYFMNK